MKKIYCIFSLLIFAFAGNLPAQDIHFSQVTETPLFLSPANTGFFNGYWRVSANYRNQWAAMNNAFSTIAISVDGGLFKSRKRKAFMGLGFTLFSDQAGAAKISKTTGLLNLSGCVKLTRHSSMSIGLAGGAAATNANYANLVYGSQFDGNTYDPTASSGEKVVFRQFTTTDVAAGVAYEYTSAKSDQDHDDLTTVKIAFGAYHLNKPEQNFGAGSNYPLPVRLSWSVISHIDIEDTRFSVTPTLVFQTQKPFYELIGGTYLKIRTSIGTKNTGKVQENGLGVGLFYRVNDALIPKLIYEAGDFAIGLSYDVNLSGYRTASKYMGGFEVSLRYNSLASSLFAARKEFR